MSNFKPMLSGSVEDASALKLPLLASVKLDGIRAMVINGVLVSRNLKPIPNTYAQKLFGKRMFEGLDGELIVGKAGDPDVFRRTSSGVMSVDGQPDVYFHVFDCMSEPELPFIARWEHARHTSDKSDRVIVVPQVMISVPAQLDEFEAAALGDGYEGVMLRSANAPYKYGRGTVKAQDLMKLKRFADAEARVVGFEEQMHNTNEAKRDALGHTERSSKKAGMVGKGTLGALKVVGVNGVYKGVAFNIGTGFDDALRAEIWANQPRWQGAVVKFKYFPSGSKEAPRFPVYLGQRSKGDMS